MGGKMTGGEVVTGSSLEYDAIRRYLLIQPFTPKRFVANNVIILLS